MLPIMQEELVSKLKWITEQDLIDYFAIGNTTPGIIAVNVSTFAGFKRAGVLGGIIGTAGIASPSLIIIMSLATVIDKVSESSIVTRALNGVNVAVAALLTNISFTFIKKTIKNFLAALIVIVSFILIFFFNLPSYIIILSSIVLGVFIYLINKRGEKGKKKGKER